MEATFEKNSTLNKQRKLILKVTMPNYVGLYFAKSKFFCEITKILSKLKISRNSDKILQNTILNISLNFS